MVVDPVIEREYRKNSTCILQTYEIEENLHMLSLFYQIKAM